MGSKDLAEKNLLQYKDVFSDIINVNLFGGRHYISANELSRESGELITKSSSDNKLNPVITLVLNYSQKEWKKPKQLQDVLNIPKDIKNMLLKHIPSYAIDVINLANQSESTMQMYHSDFKYIVRYLSCKNDKEKLESFFRTTDFKLDHPEAFLDWLAAVANDDRYIKAKQLIDKQNEKGGHINMCVLLDMYEERGINIGEERGIHEINTLNLHLLEDNRMEDMQRAMVDTDYQKELMKEYSIGV